MVLTNLAPNPPFRVRSRWLKYFYLNNVPSQDDLEWPKLSPSYEDFLKAVRRRRELCVAEKNMGQNRRIFAMTEKYKLPRELSYTAANLKKTGKNAGPLSNQVMAAASAFVTHAAQSPDAIQGAWTGQDQ